MNRLLFNSPFEFNSSYVFKRIVVPEESLANPHASEFELTVVQLTQSKFSSNIYPSEHSVQIFA